MTAFFNLIIDYDVSSHIQILQGFKTKKFQALSILHFLHVGGGVFKHAGHSLTLTKPNLT